MNIINKTIIISKEMHNISIYYDERNTNLIHVRYFCTKSLDLQTCNVNSFRALKIVWFYRNS